MTCGAPGCDFSVDSVVLEGPSRLGSYRAGRGGRKGVLTWRTGPGADSTRVRVMRSHGQGSQLIPSRAHPNLELQTQNKRVSKGEGVRYRKGLGGQYKSDFFSFFKEAWQVLAFTGEEGRGV